MSSGQPDTKSKVEQLARIRDNQRRSRARKRDYIALLETKVRQYELEPPIKSLDSEYTQKLVRENEQLRGLLKCMGFDEKFQETFLKASSHAPTFPQMSPEQQTSPSNITAFEPSSNLSGSETIQQPTGASTPPADIQLASNLTFNPGVEYIFPNNLPDTFDSDLLDLSPSAFLTPTAVSRDLGEGDCLDLDVTAPAPNFLPIPLQNASSGDRTLCRIAYSVLLQYDRTGASLVELDLKLQAGYQGCSMRDCTVDNRVLFSVLAEIS